MTICHSPKEPGTYFNEGAFIKQTVLNHVNNTLRTSFFFYYFYSSVIKDSGLLGCEAASLLQWLLAFPRQIRKRFPTDAESHPGDFMLLLGIVELLRSVGPIEWEMNYYPRQGKKECRTYKKIRKATSVGHILRRYCLPKHIIERRIER